MSALLQPFVFKYMDAGEMKTLEFIPDGCLLPVSRIVNCLGMNWRNNHERVRVYKSFQTLKFSGRSQREAALDGEDFISWLLSVNRLKVKKPELVKHFQEHFPILWRNYRYEVENPHLEVEAIGDRSEDDPEYKAIMQEMGIDTTIYIDRDLSKPERYIALLAKFRHMDPIGLRYYRSIKEVRLCQELPKNMQEKLGKTHRLIRHPFELEINVLRHKIRQGYLPDYVFFLEYPEYYDKEPVIQAVVEWDASGKSIQKLQQVDISPLSSLEYYEKVQRRKQEDKKIMIENFKREVAVDNDTDISEYARKKWDFSSLGIPQKSDYDPNYGTARAWAS